MTSFAVNCPECGKPVSLWGYVFSPSINTIKCKTCATEYKFTTTTATMVVFGLFGAVLALLSVPLLFMGASLQALFPAYLVYLALAMLLGGYLEALYVRATFKLVKKHSSE